MRHLILVTSSVFAAALVGCPSMSGLVLAGDPELVGTWEGTGEFLGHKVDIHVTYSANGSFHGVMMVRTDNSTMGYGGKWYADPTKGWLDTNRTWTRPHIPEALGKFEALYEIKGNTFDVWNDPVNMPRPPSRQAAGVHVAFTRHLNKVEELPDSVVTGICQDILDSIP